MTKTRATIFGDDETVPLDLSGFVPKPQAEIPAPPAEKVRAVSQAANFKSREPAPAKSAVPPQAAPSKREPRRHRTGRNVQFNIKALRETVETFYAITDRRGWVLGETLERAVAALQRELKEPV